MWKDMDSNIREILWVFGFVTIFNEEICFQQIKNHCLKIIDLCSELRDICGKYMIEYSSLMHTKHVSECHNIESNNKLMFAQSSFIWYVHSL